MSEKAGRRIRTDDLLITNLYVSLSRFVCYCSQLFALLRICKVVTNEINMKSSTQSGSLLNMQSGQEVAKRRFGKTDVRYWSHVIFKPTYSKAGKTLNVQHWAARIQW